MEFWCCWVRIVGGIPRGVERVNVVVVVSVFQLSICGWLQDDVFDANYLLTRWCVNVDFDSI